MKGLDALCLKLREAVDLTAIRAWAEQQYLMSISLGPAFAALAARVPGFDRLSTSGLMNLAYEETWDIEERNHGEAFKAFYESLGGQVDRLGTFSYLRETLDAANFRLHVAQGRHGESFNASLLAIAEANERANLTIFQRLSDATQSRVYTSMNRAYFKCHINDEEAHRQLLSTIAARYPPHKGEDVDMVVSELLTVRDKFFGAVADEIAAAVN